MITIIGGGVAGLMAALAAAPAPVTLINPRPLGEGAASWLSQGGMAAAVGADDDVALHIQDTLAAGAGLCDRAAVERIVGAGPALVETLLGYGVAFDRRPDGALSLGLEAAHSRHRILHGGGDQTGATIMRALIEKMAQTPSITLLQAVATRIFVGEAGVEGVQLRQGTRLFNLATDRVLLATGGIGGLFRYSTNPVGAIGQGLMLAKAAGAGLKHLEFVQFHPTALASESFPCPLVSEAVRGEGARFIDETGAYFMNGRDLAPRDVVARGVFGHLAAGHKVFLDARPLADFANHFPTIQAACLAAGIDPARDPIPVRPAAHYHMGGVAVDADGRSDVDGLFAAGEVACTGLHGANRLASNSLLEAAICGAQAGRVMAGMTARPLRSLPDMAAPPAPDAEAVREIMSADCGVMRSEAGLARAEAALAAMAGNPAAELSLAIVQAARARKHSVGAHARIDQPLSQAA
ncbi:L-aspartate oxidase [Acidocella sp. MX-AZ02]|uniref:L-aspartate oxidase n=1 Tax=Acidocella sp. MX-AZ02 TaxID=1214225 RepID=UPI00028ED850|nr:L-aspartate oxidase [Acidocella sp. MX-AZ02]EKN00349.1 L-aspartate oxidase [Acidocella sp. MX-AZ02]